MTEGRRPKGVSPRPRSGAVAESARLRWHRNGQEELPHVQGVVGARVLEGLRSFSTFEVRRGGGEEIPLVQGKEQRLRFAGTAVKRYPTSKVRETQVRW